MAYRDNIAPGRADIANPAASVKKDVVIGGASNQERGVSSSSIREAISPVRGKYNEGDLVKFQPNNKGTGIKGVPTAIALSGKDFGMPANSNPDGKTNR